MSKTIIQFGYINKHPEGPAIDCRVIPNPYKKGATLPEATYRARVRTHPLFLTLVNHGVQMLEDHDTLWVGCLYGVHRSGAVAEEIAAITGATIVRSK